MTFEKLFGYAAFNAQVIGKVASESLYMAEDEDESPIYTALHYILCDMEAQWSQTISSHSGYLKLRRRYSEMPPEGGLRDVEASSNSWSTQK